jgi:glutamate synthase domain-containing protein 3
VSVKLVAESGVGTVAAGVAKARADRVLISGYDGGTGASPLSSIKHAGAPWELGLAETQQTLVLNRLRDRIRVQTDGQIKTGRDVVIGGAAGRGGIRLRDGAAGGVRLHDAAQVPHQRVPVRRGHAGPRAAQALFRAKPEHVIQFFRFIAGKCASSWRAGVPRVRRPGRALRPAQRQPAITFWKAKGLDFSGGVPPRGRQTGGMPVHGNPQPSPIADALDYRLLPQVQPAIDGGDPVVLRVPVRNTDRAVGTLFRAASPGATATRGCPTARSRWSFDGSAGQSFGAFAAKGLTLILNGEANDYLGKGLSGGKIVVKPAPGATFDPAQNTIAGNVLLYGATCGEAYLNGCVGERFAVRNSGAWAVVEGVGDHGCEYMTGGRVAILGPTGVNFAAGMSGGIAYVLDENGMFDAAATWRWWTWNR